jgi:hypothetical protein
MAPENKNRIPDWAQQERLGDMRWIRENAVIFQGVASRAFREQGRGAIVVDTTSLPVPGLGHPMAYFPQAEVEKSDNPDLKRMVREYQPQREFVVHLLKSENRTSTYRIGNRPVTHQN